MCTDMLLGGGIVLQGLRALGEKVNQLSHGVAQVLLLMRALILYVNISRAWRESEPARKRGGAECTGNECDPEARGQHGGCGGEDCELGRRATPQEIIMIPSSSMNARIEHIAESHSCMVSDHEVFC